MVNYYIYYSLLLYKTWYINYVRIVGVTPNKGVFSFLYKQKVLSLYSPETVKQTAIKRL